MDCRPAKIRILIADDQALLRDGIRARLCRCDEFEIVAEAADGDEFIQKAREFAPDVVLMDLAMPVMGDMETARRVRKIIPKAKLLLLSQDETKEYILSAIEAGADGYIAKKASDSELVAAIRVVRGGGCYLSAAAAKALMESYRHKPRLEPYNRLTVRQREILKLTADGHTSRQIGQMTNTSFKTVQNHRMKMMKKLGVHNHTKLIEYAARKGLTNLKAHSGVAHVSPVA